MTTASFTAEVVLQATGFGGMKLSAGDMVQLAVKPLDQTLTLYVLSPRVYMIGEPSWGVSETCKLSNGWAVSPALLVRADKADEIINAKLSLLRYPTPREALFRMEPMLNDKELGLLQLLREKPGKAGTLKEPADKMPDMYKHLVQRGYCRITEALVGPLRAKTGEHMICLTEAGEIAMTAQLLTGSKDLESRASYECPNGHQLVEFVNGQPVCNTCAAHLKRVI